MNGAGLQLVKKIFLTERMHQAPGVTPGLDIFLVHCKNREAGRFTTSML